MLTIRQTTIYEAWFAGLRDERARARIDVRIKRLALGNAGDVKPVGEGVSELRIDYGPGYRVYFAQRGSEIVLLLCGGDKRTQDRDIREAQSLNRQEKQR
ncbi:type II toxin-antitoxin system RelE/ParE family toxin [Methylobacterium brachiatum]|jgi:putative addiction module killer protein|uniref:type II toxin-antitoxin system RelE/ParE family toxin n=1 Tax=Methylobacterium brachiatum TaxID=269660 RepID=UPI000EFB10DF|nr:type II toxin-antitoxin system RelE/ParE family toxin [Methylobacterium brachiatum]AYO83321.1 type II toxin-antitoxin system RelE/ParE family toxin [Methylobacterium brachiatum]MDH2308611.1 type II toxin-antitoxin system RelE/ParE family toxin [Methylobacterium brachiatum]